MVEEIVLRFLFMEHQIKKTQTLTRRLNRKIMQPEFPPPRFGSFKPLTQMCVSSLQGRQDRMATHFLHAGQIPGLCVYETMTTWWRNVESKEGGESKRTSF